MSFKLKAQKYAWPYFLLIPLQCAPFPAIAVMLQKILTGLSAVFQVVVTAKFIDGAVNAVTGKTSAIDVLPWLILLIVLVGWRRISFNIGSLFTKQINIICERDLSKEFTAKRAKIQFRYVEDPDTWNLVDRVCTNIQLHVREMFQRSLNLVLYLIRIFGVLYIVFTQVWWIGILITVLVVPLIFISFRGGKKTYSAQKAASEYDRRHKYLLEVLTGRESVDERTLFGFSKHLGNKWFETFEQARKIRLNAEMKWNISVNGGAAVTNLLSTIVTVALVFPVVYGQISIGMFIAIASAVFDLVNLMGWEMSRVVTQLSKYNEYLKDFTRLANLDEDEGAVLLPETVDHFDSLEFKNVSFKYPGTDTYILNNLNMRMENGVHYALVGRNGSGKTTITKLITGLYDNYEGQILLNNKELRDYSKAYLKGMFSGVYQDFAKYFISVKDNILLGDVNNMENPQAMENAKQAASDFNILNDINDLPKGFDTPLGKIEENGVDFSGGQWQRIAMVRSLVSPAPMRILDEPTSALDPISESNMYENFGKMNKGKTTVFISHRLGATKISDKIFVIEQGSVIQQGSHEELMEQGGMYAEMYESQRSWYK